MNSGAVHFNVNTLWVATNQVKVGNQMESMTYVMSVMSGTEKCSQTKKSLKGIVAK